MDDVLIFSKSLEKHIEHISTIFDCFTKANLKLQIDKCKLAKEGIELLGNTIYAEGLKPSKLKVDAINRIKLLTSQKQIKSFLGMTGYLRRYKKDYA